MFFSLAGMSLVRASPKNKHLRVDVKRLRLRSRLDVHVGCRWRNRFRSVFCPTFLTIAKHESKGRHIVELHNASIQEFALAYGECL